MGENRFHTLWLDLWRFGHDIMATAVELAWFTIQLESTHTHTHTHTHGIGRHSRQPRLRTPLLALTRFTGAVESVSSVSVHTGAHEISRNVVAVSISTASSIVHCTLVYVYTIIRNDTRIAVYHSIFIPKNGHAHTPIVEIFGTGLCISQCSTLVRTLL